MELDSPLVSQLQKRHTETSSFLFLVRIRRVPQLI